MHQPQPSKQPTIVGRRRRDNGNGVRGREQVGCACRCGHVDGYDGKLCPIHNVLERDVCRSWSRGSARTTVVLPSCWIRCFDMNALTVLIVSSWMCVWYGLIFYRGMTTCSRYDCWLFPTYRRRHLSLSEVTHRQVPVSCHEYGGGACDGCFHLVVKCLFFYTPSAFAAAVVLLRYEVRPALVLVVERCHIMRVDIAHTLAIFCGMNASVPTPG